MCFDVVIELDSKNINAWRAKLILNERLLMINFADSLAWNNKGNALRNLGRYEEAIRAFDASIGFDSRSPTAWYNMGVVLIDLEKHDEAIECFCKATGLDTSYSKALYAKGLALVSQAKYKEAIKAFDAAIKINPRCIKAWRTKSVALRALGHDFEADVASAVASGLV